MSSISLQSPCQFSNHHPRLSALAKVNLESGSSFGWAINTLSREKTTRLWSDQMKKGHMVRHALIRLFELSLELLELLFLHTSECDEITDNSENFTFLTLVLFVFVVVVVFDTPRLVFQSIHLLTLHARKITALSTDTRPQNTQFCNSLFCEWQRNTHARVIAQHFLWSLCVSSLLRQYFLCYFYFFLKYASTFVWINLLVHPTVHVKHIHIFIPLAIEIQCNIILQDKIFKIRT